MTPWTMTIREGLMTDSDSAKAIRIIASGHARDSPNMFSLLTLIMLLTLISRSLRFKLILDLELSLRLNVRLSPDCCPR